MNLFKALGRMFSGGSGGDVGLYYYVKCARCGEVIQVRINPMNDLSVQYGEDGRGRGDTFIVHKTLVGRRCYNRIEADFTFDANRQLSDKQITGGKFVDRAEFEADQKRNSEQST